MAQVIELFGAPGVGKSELVRALERRRIGHRRVVAAQRLVRVPRSGPWRRVLHRALTRAERRAALAARRDDWADLLGLIATTPRDAATAMADPLRTIHGARWVADTLELRALAEAAPDDVVVVLDEGLVQRVPLVCGSDPDDATLDRLLAALPVPRLYVNLTARPDDLVARIRARERRSDRTFGLDEVGLAARVTSDTILYRRCAESLRRASRPILEVPTDRGRSGPVDAVVTAIENVG